MKNCNVCKKPLNAEPILKLEGLPSEVQHLKVDSFVPGTSLELFECSGCGLVQLTVKPVSYYKECIRSMSKAMQDFRRDQFRDFVEKYSLSGKKLIELGCGGGEYLNLFSGVQRYGLEGSSTLVDKCKQGGLNVIHGYMTDITSTIPEGPFDAFASFNFLEHVPDLNGFLTNLLPQLIDGAIGLVEVPNFDMILKEQLFSEFMAEHLYYFTSDTLKSTLQLNGFDVISIEPVWNNYCLSAVVRKRTKLDLSLFAVHQAKIANEISEYASKFGRLAVWGAGHQAIAIISTCGLSHKLKYIVDSSPVKQGKLAPVCGVRIVSPETLATDPVDGVIIVAGSYADEVYKQIENMGVKLPVAMLRSWGVECK